MFVPHREGLYGSRYDNFRRIAKNDTTQTFKLSKAVLKAIDKECVIHLIFDKCIRLKKEVENKF
jgi:hypothetical protein